MKLDRWAKIQTVAVLKKVGIAIVLVVAPLFIFSVFWNQSLQVNTLFTSNRNTLVAAIQTGDLILLDRVLSAYRASTLIVGYTLLDLRGENLRNFQRNPAPTLSFTEVNELKTADGQTWGALILDWAPRFDFALYFLSIGVAITFVVGVVVFKSWNRFSRQLVGAIEEMQSYGEEKSVPAFIQKIDDLRTVFEQLQSRQTQVIANNKLKLEREKEKALIDLSQKVAHDLRTPLSSLSLILSNVAMDQERRSILDMSMQRMRDICEELLLERKVNHKSNEQFGTVINHSVDELKILYPGVAVDVRIDAKASGAIIDDVLFKSVLSNLLKNAFEAIDPVSGIIQVDFFFSDGRYCLSIKDNGKGISEELKSLLGHSPVTFGKGLYGNGLGFYNARKWATNKAGNLSIEANQGAGTVVCLEIPSQS